MFVSQNVNGPLRIQLQQTCQPAGAVPDEQYAWPAPPASVDNMLVDMLDMQLMIGLFVSEAAI